MIYDVFLFHNEVDLLRLRLEELGDVVDKFVILQTDVTMRGKRKDFFFGDPTDEISKWREKLMCIRIHDQTFDEGPQANFDYETRMRSHLDRELSPQLQNDDIVIFGDADEIVPSDSVKAYTIGMGAWRFWMHFSYYFMNLRRPDNTFRSIVSPGKLFKKLGFNYMRWGFPAGNNVFNPGGWHFSFLGGVDSLREKISRAAEGRASDWVFTEDRAILETRINEGKLYSGTEQYSFVPVDESFPRHVRENQDYWKAKGFLK